MISKLTAWLSTPLRGGNTRGASLIEVMMAVMVTAIVTAISVTAYTNFQQAAMRRDAVTAAGNEVNALNARFKHFWMLRSHPPYGSDGDMDNPVPDYSATWPGFCPMNGGACKSAFPALVRLNMDTVPSKYVTIGTSCRDAPSNLKGIDFSASSSCASCQGSQIPYVYVDGTAMNAVMQNFPASVRGTSGTIVALSICFDPWSAGNPLTTQVWATTMDPAGKPMVTKRTLVFPVNDQTGVITGQ